MCDSVKYHVTLYMYYVMAWTGMGPGLPDSCTGPNVGLYSVADPMMVQGRLVCNTMQCCGTAAGALGPAPETLTLAIQQPANTALEEKGFPTGVLNIISSTLYGYDALMHTVVFGEDTQYY